MTNFFFILQVFTENEFKKTITIDIINDNQYEADADFYIILKNAKGGSGLGDPSVTRVTIVDDDGKIYLLLPNINILTRNRQKE